jgi:AcrR family transcriptional regulator
MSGGSRKTKERILLTAIRFLENGDMEAVTTRDIAREAEVNIASIHYHFGTKDKLIDAALVQTLQNAFGSDLFDLLADASLRRRERLSRVFTFLLRGALRFPGITRSHFILAFRNRTADTDNLRMLRSFSDRLVTEVGGLYPDMEPAVVGRSIRQILGVIFFHGLFPGIFAEPGEDAPESVLAAGASRTPEGAPSELSERDRKRSAASRSAGRLPEPPLLRVSGDGEAVGTGADGGTGMGSAGNGEDWAAAYIDFTLRRHFPE